MFYLILYVLIFGQHTSIYLVLELKRHITHVFLCLDIKLLLTRYLVLICSPIIVKLGTFSSFLFRCYFILISIIFMLISSLIYCIINILVCIVWYLIANIIINFVHLYTRGFRSHVKPLNPT